MTTVNLIHCHGNDVCCFQGDAGGIGAAGAIGEPGDQVIDIWYI